MVIAIQKGLDEIKQALSVKGYQIVDPESYSYPIDALIYVGNSFQISHISGNNMPIKMENEIRSNYGVLLINSLGKSIGEIEDMLTTRYYSPLF